MTLNPIFFTPYYKQHGGKLAGYKKKTAVRTVRTNSQTTSLELYIKTDIENERLHHQIIRAMIQCIISEDIEIESWRVKEITGLVVKNMVYCFRLWNPHHYSQPHSFFHSLLRIASSINASL